jgi:hypothetical protein
MAGPHDDTTCPGCGLVLRACDWPLPDGFDASRECFERYGELASWTQSLGDPAFPHQHAVDAWAAQHASAAAPPIRTTFALVGLYLACERGFTGREVQLAHVRLARRNRDWPRFVPERRATMTIADVLAAESRTAALLRWSANVWDAWAHEQARVHELVTRWL